MPAAKVNLVIEQGAKWRQELVWKDGDGVPVDVTGYSARMQVRRTVKSTVVAQELTSGAEITLGTTGGEITLELDADVTSELRAGKYVYDLELVPGDDPEGVVRLAQGKVTVSPEVTR